MKSWFIFILSSLLVIGLLAGTHFLAQGNQPIEKPGGRVEVIFWHFWGGQDRDVVEQIVADFNASQKQYWVRAVAMPGNNLDTKIFLSITGGDPPDLVNQDDPIVADWAARGLIYSIDEIAPQEEVERLNQDLLPSAKLLGTYNNQLYAVCNGLDIRALYYNKTALDQFDLTPPESIEQLNEIALTIAPKDFDGKREHFGYLPDSRRLWAWGYVFGGDFFDFDTQKATCDDQAIVRALDWMKGYSDWYGPDTISAFRQGDQSLPGKAFPLLPVTSDKLIGRYVVLMDGQWRTRDIRLFINERTNAGLPSPEFGVCPLPSPQDGRHNAGWVNGNFFVVPKGAKSKQGAWEFIKFWLGHPDADRGAKYCEAGGWIPTTKSVTESLTFKNFLDHNDLFAKFVELAKSENQFPVPVVPGAPLFKRTIEQTAGKAMSSPQIETTELLGEANENIQRHLDRALKRDE